MTRVMTSASVCILDNFETCQSSTKVPQAAFVIKENVQSKTYDKNFTVTTFVLIGKINITD